MVEPICGMDATTLSAMLCEMSRAFWYAATIWSHMSCTRAPRMETMRVNTIRTSRKTFFSERKE